MDIEVKCNHCNNFYDVDETHTGQEIECPECGKKFIIAPHNTDQTQPAEHSLEAETEDDLILGLYRLEGEVAEGGMGKVFKVHHTTWNVDLAMKQPHAHMFETEEQKETFFHECEAWINLGLHPHIVSCYYVREINGVPNIFAEWMEGGDLAHWIESRKLYEGDEKDIMERILDIAIQFAWGLDYAHEQGLIHQDVKPENVMLTPEGDVKIADFGIANAKLNLSETSTTTSQFNGTMVSKGGAYTPAYCSPEQSTGQKLTRRTDIWSWAVSVLEMFTEDRLWQSGVIAGSACDEYFEFAEIDIPESLQQLLRECFNEDESERPRDFKLIAGELLEIYQMEMAQDYSRAFPKVAADSPDSLNNRALSYKDMGKTKKAEELWAKALQIDPHHLESTYNQGMLLWRTGRTDDIALVRQLEEVRTTHSDPWEVEHLLGLVHLERYDSANAATILEDSKERSNGEIDAQEALKSAKEMERKSNPPITLDFDDGVNSVVFSPDGRYFLSGGDGDNALRLWNAETRECTRTFEGHSGKVTSVAFSPVGHYCLSGSWDHVLKLWDVKTGECIRTFEGHSAWVNSVDFSPDKRFAVSGGNEKTVRLWNTQNGECIKEIDLQVDGISSVAFSPDGRHCLLGGWALLENSLKLCDIESGEFVRAFGGQYGGASSVAFSPDGRCFVTGKGDSLKLWDIESGECVRTFEGHSDKLNSVAFSPDGKFVISGSSDKSVKLWDVEMGKCIRTFEGHCYAVNSVAFSPDGKSAISGSSDKTLKVWDLCCFYETKHTAGDILSRITDTAEMIELDKQYKEIFKSIEHSDIKGDIDSALKLIEKARKLPKKGRREDLMIWKLKIGGKCRKDLLTGAWARRTFDAWPIASVSSVAFNLDGHYCVSSSKDENIELWDIGSGKWIKTLEGHSSWVSSVAFSPVLKEQFLSGSWDKTLKLWDVATGECIRTLEGHSDVVDSVAFSPDGKFAISGSWDKSVKLWDVEMGKCIRTFEGHSDRVDAVAFSPDGRWCFSGSWDQTLKLWDLERGECKRTNGGHSKKVTSVAFSPDGSLALSGSDDRALKLWDVATGECIRTFEGHSDAVNSVAFSPDGKFAISGSRDKTLKLWDVARGECIRTFEGHSDLVNVVAFSPDGNYCLSGGADKMLILWELDWQYEFPGWSDWDDGAAPYLRNFLTSRGNQLNDDDFEWLMNDLKNRGYGWLWAEGVSKKLEEMGVTFEKENIGTIAYDSITDDLDNLWDLSITVASEDSNSIGGYRKLERIGGDTLSEIWKVKSLSNDAEYALKLMKPQDIADFDLLWERYINRSYNGLKEICHPNILRNIDYGKVDKEYFLVTEYCQHGSLADFMEDQKNEISVDLALCIVMQILDALEYVHHFKYSFTDKTGKVTEKASLIHDNLNIHSIFLSGDVNKPEVKIGNYGFNMDFYFSVTGLDLIPDDVMEVAFIPRIKVLDARYEKTDSDIWSTAAILYYMLSGKPPKAYSGIDPVHASITKSAIPILKQAPNIPKKLAEVIDEALIDNPEIKIKSAGELKEKLKNTF